MTLRLLPILALSCLICAAAPPAHAAARHTAHKTAAKTSPEKKAAERKSEKKPEKKKAAARTKAKESPRARTEVALRDQTDSFVALIDAGKQDLTDARIAWGAKRPEVACQRARAAKTRFAKARGVVDGMVKTARDGKADAAPYKALYPKTDELDDATRRLIGTTCAG